MRFWLQWNAVSNCLQFGWRVHTVWLQWFLPPTIASHATPTHAIPHQATHHTTPRCITGQHTSSIPYRPQSPTDALYCTPHRTCNELACSRHTTPCTTPHHSNMHHRTAHLKHATPPIVPLTHCAAHYITLAMPLLCPGSNPVHPAC